MGPHRNNRLIVSFYLVSAADKSNRYLSPRRPSGHPLSARMVFDYTAQARTVNDFRPLSNSKPLTGAENPKYQPAESFGQLVALGFDVTVFTPAPYRRPRLGRPS